MEEKTLGKNPTVISLALPIAVETCLRNLINTLNVLLLSHYADAAASGVGVANQVMNIVNMFAASIALGAAVIINYDLGARDEKKASVSVMNSLMVAGLFGALVSVGLFISSHGLMQLVGLEGETLAYAADYLKIAGLSAVMMTLSQGLSTVFRAYKDAKIPMFVLTGGNLIALFCTWASMHFEGKLPFSPVQGVALGKLLGDALGVVVLFSLQIAKHYGFSLKNAFRPDRGRILRMLSVGASSSTESLSYNIGTLLTTSFIATGAGAAALSAKVYVCTINPYEQVIGYSLGQSGQILSSRLIGAKKYDEAYKRVNSLWKYLVLFNLLCSSLIFLFHENLVGLFTDDQEIIRLTAPLFLLEIVINFSRTLNHCFNSGNRSANYVFWPAVVALVSLWSIYVGCGYLFCNGLGWGITGIWIAMALDESLRGSINASFWLRKKWRKKWESDSPAKSCR